MTLALADVDTGRLLRALSLGGPTTAHALAGELALSLKLTRELLRDTAALGVVRLGVDGRYQVEPAVVIALVRQNCVQLLGAVA